MTLDQILFLSAALCAATYLWQTTGPQGTLRSLTKTASVALLALAAAWGGAPLLLVLALAACAVGDFCLSRDGDTYFMAGIGAFALGHLGYIALFLGLSDSDPAQLLMMPHLAPVIVLLCVGLAMAALLAPRAGALKIPVLCYIPIILGMGLAALTVPGQGMLLLLLSASLLFILSDMVLAAETFVLKPDHPARRVTPYVIWVTYWGAQAGFFTTFA
ncbi:lysoplasmalogenase [Sedimentitalea sp. CY04]|uniref:Lysoplasmalogenase n=1 Tax=Parasedimentitalea denitrificans TaxID=2211118 RepID=A0ABX0W7R5_9RHOB|nr:lysoplasmalogenase [Sedimentitalea sp. CY04]NIZ61308.1 lysoplasmalogenase [Sedimentitalea sp. CY04]